MRPRLVLLVDSLRAAHSSHVVLNLRHSGALHGGSVSLGAVNKHHKVGAHAVPQIEHHLTAVCGLGAVSKRNKVECHAVPEVEHHMAGV